MLSKWKRFQTPRMTWHPHFIVFEELAKKNHTNNNTILVIYNCRLKFNESFVAVFVAIISSDWLLRLATVAPSPPPPSPSSSSPARRQQRQFFGKAIATFMESIRTRSTREQWHVECVADQSAHEERSELSGNDCNVGDVDGGGGARARRDCWFWYTRFLVSMAQRNFKVRSNAIFGLFCRQNYFRPKTISANNKAAIAIRQIKSHTVIKIK